jgi:CelD/BcsL family acetyltransferase involved in cellulose biosynthesis
VIFRATRGAILDTQKAGHHLTRLPQKTRQENQRIRKRFFEKSGARYVTSDKPDSIDWLGDYLQLEHAGWKGRVKGSILSDDGVESYYLALYESNANLRKIQFQGLYAEQGPLAISFRLVSNGRAFDVKTTFDENYRELYPGVNLELCNMLDLENYRYEFVDSCTVSDNYLINRLWPDQRNILTSVYFKAGLVSQLLKKIYRWSLSHHRGYDGIPSRTRAYRRTTANPAQSDHQTGHEVVDT